jgi:hypothetical protein
MAYELSVAAPPQQSAVQPPLRFVRKARASYQSWAASTESAWYPARSELDKVSDETLTSCPRTHDTSSALSRAKYNRIIGEMIREEDNICFEYAESCDVGRFEEIFFQLSTNFNE